MQRCRGSAVAGKNQGRAYSIGGNKRLHRGSEPIEQDGSNIVARTTRQPHVRQDPDAIGISKSRGSEMGVSRDHGGYVAKRGH